MRVKLASQPIIDSIVDGPGLRTVFWFQGCKHHCKNCHNPRTWDFNQGFFSDTDELVTFFLNQSLQSGVTISGGDPFYQQEALLDLLKKLKYHKINIWVYTGFLYEELESNDCLNYIDVLVDGPYIEGLRDLNLYFKGSSNQRVINVVESLKTNKIILV